MSAHSLPDESSPRAQLALSRDLARRVRRTQQATWLPLLVFAVVTLAAIPVARAGHPAGLVCRSAAGPPPIARVCVAHNSATFVYWPIALVLAYAIIAAFYLRRARAQGVGSRGRPYVIAGIVLALVLTGASIWAAGSPLVGQYDILGWHAQGLDLNRLIVPACAIGLGLLVLAAVERSVMLFAVAITYLVIAIGGINFGWTLSEPSRWGLAPHLIIQASVLLLASLGFAVAQRPAGRSGT